MKISLTSVLVDDQAKALKFYSAMLGFQKKKGIDQPHWPFSMIPAGI